MAINHAKQLRGLAGNKCIHTASSPFGA